MLKIRLGKTMASKGVPLPPLCPKPAPEKKEAFSSGASTSLKDVFKKHESIRKANITAEKNT